MGATDVMRKSIWTRFGFAWVTSALFILTLTGHWIFGWFAYVNEQAALQQPAEVGAYTVQMMRDTLENWQSEFLQPLWQGGGLRLFFYLSSPHPRAGADTHEERQT